MPPPLPHLQLAIGPGLASSNCPRGLAVIILGDSPDRCSWVVSVVILVDSLPTAQDRGFARSPVSKLVMLAELVGLGTSSSQMARGSGLDESGPMLVS